MANIPTYIQLPTSPPTTDPAVAGYISQFQIALNAWILQAATAINNSLSSLTITDWKITETSTGDLLFTFTGNSPVSGATGGSWTLPQPNGNSFTVKSV